MKYYIARDCDGSLWLFKGHKPKRNEHDIFVSEHRDYVELDDTWFSKVTVENSPQEVKLKLVQ